VTPERYRFSAAVGGRRAHEHDPGVGRWESTRTTFSTPCATSSASSCGRISCSPAACTPATSRSSRTCARKRIEKRAPPAQPSQPWGCGRATTRNEAAWRGWWLAAEVQPVAQGARTVISADYKRMFPPAAAPPSSPPRIRGAFYSRSSPSANEDDVPRQTASAGATCTTGAFWHSEAPLPELRRQHLALHERVRLPIVPGAGLGGALHTARNAPTGTSAAPSCCRTSATRAANALIRTYMDRDFRPSQGLCLVPVRGPGAAGDRDSSSPPRRTAAPWGATGAASTGSSTTAGRSRPGRASTTTAAGRRCNYFARQFFAPVLVSPVEDKGVVNVWAISDRRTDTPARLTPAPDRLRRARALAQRAGTSS